MIDKIKNATTKNDTMQENNITYNAGELITGYTTTNKGAGAQKVMQT